MTTPKSTKKKPDQVDPETLAQKRKREGIMAGLNKKLGQTSQIGEVCSVVVYSQKKKVICCSGYPIAPEVLFGKLNVVGTGTAIKYPPLHSLAKTRCQRGHFVRLNQFEKGAEDDRWVALIDVMISEEDSGEIFPFPWKPPRA